MSSQTFLHLAGDKLIISFDRNPLIEASLKKIPGARFNKGLSRWESPLHTYPRLLDVFDNIKISKAVMDRFAADAELRRKVEDLRKKEYHEIIDYSSKAALMSHQKKAFELHRLLPGSANYSEMGSGKTGSAICNAHWRIEMGHTERVLVICPKSVIRGWEEQIEFFSNLTYTSITGSKKEDRLEKLNSKKDIYLVNYEYTWRILDELLARKFNLVIADEAHRIKNPDSNQSKACYALADAAQYRIALTGTPVLNSPIDCFGIMRFVDVSVFGESFYSFRSKYFRNVGPENSPIPIYIPKAGANEEISDKLYTRALRFLKEECMDLPMATHLPDRLVTLSIEQDRAYKKLQEELSAQITETKSIKINHVLTLMLKLNQITSGWVKDPDTGEIIHFKSNPKFEELKEVVEDAGDQPTIIWAYYRADMALITEYYGRCQKCKAPVNNIANENCPKCGIYIKYRCSEIQGSTKNRNAEIAKFRYTPEERAKQREKFIDENKPANEIRSELGDLLPNGNEPPQTDIIVVQCVAGSEGLNLQRSTISIFYSRNWSLKDWTQALARNHRKGQDKRVTYINLVAKLIDGDDTIDQRIVDALKRKEDLSKKINKDDLKLLTGNYKMKDREAIRDITLEESLAQEVIVDPEAPTIIDDNLSMNHIKETSGSSNQAISEEPIDPEAADTTTNPNKNTLF